MPLGRMQLDQHLANTLGFMVLAVREALVYSQSITGMWVRKKTKYSKSSFRLHIELPIVEGFGQAEIEFQLYHALARLFRPGQRFKMVVTSSNIAQSKSSNFCRSSRRDFFIVAILRSRAKPSHKTTPFA